MNFEGVDIERMEQYHVQAAAHYPEIKRLAVNAMGENFDTPELEAPKIFSMNAGPVLQSLGISPNVPTDQVFTASWQVMSREARQRIAEINRRSS